MNYNPVTELIEKTDKSSCKKILLYSQQVLVLKRFSSISKRIINLFNGEVTQSDITIRLRGPRSFNSNWWAEMLIIDICMPKLTLNKATKFKEGIRQKVLPGVNPRFGVKHHSPEREGVQPTGNKVTLTLKVEDPNFL